MSRKSTSCISYSGITNGCINPSPFRSLHHFKGCVLVIVLERWLGNGAIFVNGFFKQLSSASCGGSLHLCVCLLVCLLVCLSTQLHLFSTISQKVWELSVRNMGLTTYWSWDDGIEDRVQNVKSPTQAIAQEKLRTIHLKRGTQTCLRSDEMLVDCLVAILILSTKRLNPLSEQ